MVFKPGSHPFNGTGDKKYVQKRMPKEVGTVTYRDQLKEQNAFSLRN